jgi:hypothetical protein
MRITPQLRRHSQNGPWYASAGPEGMATMMRYTFRALITLSPVPEDPAPCCPGRAHAFPARGCYLIQPFSCHQCLPAMISLDEGVPVSPGGPAVLTVALADSEAEAFFCPGQCFTIWADGLVGSTVQAIGRVGYGVIARRTSPARAPVDGNGIPGGVADHAVTSALMQAVAMR